MSDCNTTLSSGSQLELRIRNPSSYNANYYTSVLHTNVKILMVFIIQTSHHIYLYCGSNTPFPLKKVQSLSWQSESKHQGHFFAVLCSLHINQSNKSIINKILLITIIIIMRCGCQHLNNNTLGDHFYTIINHIFSKHDNVSICFYLYIILTYPKETNNANR